MKDQTFLEKVEKCIGDFLNTQLHIATTPESKLMIKRLEGLILRAGKRSRPRLMKLAYEAYGGKESEILVDIGAALELHHQFLLVHDDIMDNDTVRYDGPNILGFYLQDFPADKTDIAKSMALMAGNLLFSFANQLLLEHPALSAEQKVTILRLMHDVNLGVHAGQQLDVVNVLELNPAITPEVMLETAYLKTALYSLSLPMQTAAALLELKPTERQKINALAKAGGILYQLVDDYSDYFVNDSSFNNHPKYRDFRQGKVTYPLWYALEHAPAATVAVLRKQAGNKNLSDADMTQIALALESCGAKAASKQQIDDYYSQTLKALSKLTITPAGRVQFTKLLESFRV